MTDEDVDRVRILQTAVRSQTDDFSRLALEEEQHKVSEEQKTMKVLIFTVIAAFHFAETSGNNVALNRDVTGINLQSGTEDTYPYLVDGDSSTGFDSGRKVQNPGVIIDFGESVSVSSLTLTFAENCDNTVSHTGCGYKTTEIHIGNSMTHSENQECASFDKKHPPETLTFACLNGPIVGRYITLVKKTTGNTRAIYLCEFEVYRGNEEGNNVALNKDVTGINLQSGTEDTYPYLVDGDLSTCFDSGRKVANPGLIIDLGESVSVSSLTLTFADNCDHTFSKRGCGYKTTEINVGDSMTHSENQECAYINNKDPPETMTLACKNGPTVGRYVTLVKKSTGNTRAIYLCEFEVVQGCVEGNNVALNKDVTGINLQSGTEDTYPYLVDGDLSTCFDSGRKVTNPGLIIDLGESVSVSSLTLTFADNCDHTFSKRGCGYKTTEINVGDSMTHSENQECGYINNRDPPETMTFNCKNGPTVGRYVTLVKKSTGNTRAIYLCEFEVVQECVEEAQATEAPPTEAPPTEAPPTEAPPTEAPPTEAPPTEAPPTEAPPTEAPPTEAPPTEAPATQGIQTTHIPTQAPCEYPVPIADVAQGKPATQSSDKPRKDGGAEKAVDGTRNGDLLNGNSCTWSDKEYQPWWMVDLLETKDVYEVRIYNREDCCTHRIKNAQIRVGDSENFEDNPICGIMVLGKMSREQPIVIRCGCETPMRGRYVSLQLIDKTQMLTICEFEVMAG
ncbi:uncharacterized protein [Ptychodera flava]|uniref:uncharacterized protein n=1 Tax=Ptychodera flava TaxID=63121 RepID=UPI00396A2C90